MLSYFVAVGRAPTHEIINTEIFEFTLQCEVNIYSSHCNDCILSRRKKDLFCKQLALDKGNDVLSEFMP